MLANDTFSNITIDFEHFVTPWSERVSCSILFTLICCVGIFTNGVVIFLTFYTDIKKKRVNWFVANLALSDFICSAGFVCGQNFYILYRERMSPLGCSLLATFNIMAAMQEFVFPPFLAVNRYFGLYHQHLFRKIFTPRNMSLMAVSSWAYSGIILSIFTLSGHTGYDTRNEHCCIVVHGSLAWSIVYWVTIIVPLVTLFDPIVAYCNWQIYKKLYREGKEIERTLHTSVIRENREILYLSVIDMIIPIFSYSLYHIVKFAWVNRFPLSSRQAFTSIYLSTSAIRGCVVIWTLKPYRKAFRRYILRKKVNKVGTGSANVLICIDPTQQVVSDNENSVNAG